MKMEFSKILFFFLIMAHALSLTLLATPTTENQELLPFLRGSGRFLAHNTRDARTCDKYPRVCDTRGSPGPDCCKKQCVDVTIDRGNCGKCGKKCKYSEMCCEGKCVNPFRDEKHCGTCNNMCKKESSCVYGLCSYA